MKNILLLTLIILTLSGCSSIPVVQQNQKTVYYQLDLTNRADDLFHVTIFPPQLTEENSVYNFASTVPGTYKLLDFGRFVKSFQAYDENNNEINVENISTNKWRISQPEKVKKIIYITEDSYDADIKENLLSPMSGTAIDEKFALVNNYGIFGYFENMQKTPIKLKVSYPDNWMVGTALTLSSDGYYYADSYDHFADSPILLGELTKAATDVGGIKVDMFTYSESEEIYADTLLKLSEPILIASSKFIGYAPVNRYSFLTVFMSLETYQKQNLWGAGAHEHSYSSVYGLPIAPGILERISSTFAHEFFHIMTPLNLHSEVIENYNWSEPVASRHLWLYEGLTEWASEIMLLRAGEMTVTDYLKTISRKINSSGRYDKSVSLVKASEETYDSKMLQQYGNIYEKGAVVNSLLDILLLDLSSGEKGLREVFIELSKEYGKHKSFSDKDFFKIFTDKTYPEVGVFFDKYIKDTLSLPIQEYFNKIGVKLIPERIPETSKPKMGISFSPSPDKEVMIRDVTEEAAEFGFKNGDIVIKLLGEDATFVSFGKLLEKIRLLKVGDEYDAVVKRDGKEINIKANIIQSVEHNVLELVENMSPRQKELFDAWKINLTL